MLRDNFKSKHILYALVVLGLGMIGYTYWYQSPEELQAVSTVVLVVITAWYSYQLRETVEETRKGRERGAIIEIIRDGIDPMLSIIERHNATDSREKSSDGVALPDYTWEDPSSEGDGTLFVGFDRASIPMDKPIRRDIDRDNSKVIELCDEYTEIYLEYSDIRSEIEDEIRKHIRDNFLEDKKDWLENIEDGTVKDNKRVIESRYDMYANFVIEQIWDRRMEVSENKEYFQSMREELFADDLEKLQSKRSQLIEKRSEVEDVLSELRQHYVSTYHIRETQLEDTADNI